MEPDVKNKDDFKLPDVNEVLNNPIILITKSWEKVNGERLKSIGDLNSEVGFLGEGWKEYIDSDDWKNVRGVRFADSYIKVLIKLIGMQFRVIETDKETVEGMENMIPKYYVVKESLMNLTDENKKNKEVIIQIEDEEMKKILTFTEKIKNILSDPNNYAETVIKNYILNPLENKLKDKSLTKLIIRRIMTGALVQMRSTELEYDTKQRVMKIFAETFKMYYGIFGEYPFLPKDKDTLEKEWDIVLMPDTT